MIEEEPQGFRLPLHTSLTRPILLGGAPRAFAILNATIGAAIGLGLQQPFIGAPLWALLHAGAVWAALRDPWFLETWPRHLAKPSWIEFPEAASVGDLPPLFARTNEGLELVNYRVEAGASGQRYMLDRVLDAGELRLGVRAPVIVRIERVGASRRRARGRQGRTP